MLKHITIIINEMKINNIIVNIKIKEIKKVK